MTPHRSTIRFLRALPGLALLAAVLAVGVVDQDPAGRAVSIVPVECSRLGGIIRMRPDTRPPTVEALTLSCGGFGGAVGGSGVGLPFRGSYVGTPPKVVGGWARRPSFGSVATLAGTAVAAYLSVTSMREIAQKHAVPWPNPDATRSRDMRLYSVYEIDGVFRNSDGPVIERVWKYGITRVGESRPIRQLPTCADYMGTGCRWHWLREDIPGWERARQIEAMYATRYKMAYGHCPPGMSRCL